MGNPPPFVSARMSCARACRRALSTHVAGVLIAVLLGCGGSPPVDSVVLVVVDTLRADRLSFHGYERETSPRLSHHARRGVVFERAFATSPWTLPSFASLYTGRIPQRHGAGGSWQANAVPIATSIASELPTLAESLRDAGFATAAFATNFYLGREFGFDRGFDLYDRARNADLPQRRADDVVRLGLDWIDAKGGTRFFLSLHILDPHVPYDPPPDVRGRFSSGYAGELRVPLPGVHTMREKLDDLDGADRAFVSAVYDEQLVSVDAAIGRLFDGLEERLLGERTLVVITSDHGEELFEHGGFEHGHTLYQEVLHIPFVVFGPGIAPARVATPVSLVDVMPTVLDATGLEAMVETEGASLWPVLTGMADLPPRALFAESTLYGAPRRAIIEWPYKLIVEPTTGVRELFDLSADARERNDLADRHPLIAERLANTMLARMRKTTAGRGKIVEFDHDTRDGLRALGYVE